MLNLSEYHFLSANAKAPMPCKMQMTWVDIPMEDSEPNRQKPYPFPAAYLDAVRVEVEGLLKADLIVPGSD